MMWAVQFTGCFIFDIGVTAKRIMGAAHIPLGFGDFTFWNSHIIARLSEKLGLAQVSHIYDRTKVRLGVGENPPHVNQKPHIHASHACIIRPHLFPAKPVIRIGAKINAKMRHAITFR